MFSGYFYMSDIIENCDVLMTIIVMLKFTQSLRPTYSMLSTKRILCSYIANLVTIFPKFLTANYSNDSWTTSYSEAS